MRLDERIQNALHFVSTIAYDFSYEVLMADEIKEPVNFRLGRSHRQALDRLARQQDKSVGQLVREVVEEYITDQARAAWEAEARRTAAELGRSARDPRSDEAEMLRVLDASLEAFAKEWVWEDER